MKKRFKKSPEPHLPQGKRAQTRAVIAEKAARIIHQLGMHDLDVAKKKACKLLGIEVIAKNMMPSHQEVQKALSAYQQVCADPEREAQVRTLREKAYRAMLLLKHFRPKLTGMVLDGSATHNTPIQLHVFVDPPEEVMIHLINLNIPHDSGENKLQLMNRKTEYFPLYRFYLADTQIDITVFPDDSIHMSPRSNDANCIRRAGIDEVLQILGG